MKYLAYPAAVLLAAIAHSTYGGQTEDDLVGHFTSLPTTNASCGVLYTGTTVTFFDESSDREISVVVPCMNDLTTKSQSGAESRLSMNHTYRIKVSATMPKGLCCFMSATKLWFLISIQEAQ